MSYFAGKQNPDFYTQECLTTQEKLGCGQQETFRNCADVCIGDG